MSRALENVVTQLAKTFTDQVIEAIRRRPLDELVQPLRGRGAARALGSRRGWATRPPEELAAIRTSLVASLARHHGNVRATAREMGTSRSDVTRWMARLGIDLTTFGPSKDPPRSREELRRTLVASLARHHGNVSAVARDMGEKRGRVR